MSDSSDMQLTVGDCGRLMPPNLHVLLDTVQKLSLPLLRSMLVWLQGLSDDLLSEGGQTLSSLTEQVVLRP